MKLRYIWLILGFIGAIAAAPAAADLLYTQGSGTTLFDFLCFSTKHCSAHVSINSAGAEVGTSASPIFVGPGSAQTFPVSSAAMGTSTDAPCTVPTTTTACSEVAIGKAIANVANNPATFASQYPSGAVPITASATGTTAATTATLAGTSGKTTYICGYSIRANATANTNVTNTITGVITATMSSIMWVPANTAGLGVDEQIFTPCVPASSTNTGIAIVSGAPGTGGLVSAKGWGYQL